MTRMFPQTSAAAAVLLVILPACCAFANDPIATGWRLGETETNVSLRGLAAVDDEVIWASGAEATVIRSRDGGATWTSCGPEGYGKLDFRCVCAFSSEVACIASAGTPAVLLRTDDGGASWAETYRAESDAAFFDAMQFWDADRGLAVSDPSLLMGGEGRLWFGTGGSESDTSRLYARPGWKEPWIPVSVPMPSSQASGIFAICKGLSVAATSSTAPLFCVGGDYRATAKSKVTACMSLDEGATWQPVAVQPASFRSDVVLIPEGSPLARTWIAVGPDGTDISSDGNQWKSLSKVGFHCLTVGKSKVFACGSEGRFARIE